MFEHTVHAIDPSFFAALVRAPRLMDQWRIHEIDPQQFAADPDVIALGGPLGDVPSTDAGRSLDWYLPASVHLLRRAFPDEPEA